MGFICMYTHRAPDIAIRKSTTHPITGTYLNCGDLDKLTKLDEKNTHTLHNLSVCQMLESIATIGENLFGEYVQEYIDY